MCLRTCLLQSRCWSDVCVPSCTVVIFFFFQAEDGIRDIGVTGVQTCALPISGFAAAMRRFVDGEVASSEQVTREKHQAQRSLFNRLRWGLGYFIVAVADYRISRVLNFGLNGR